MDEQYMDEFDRYNFGAEFDKISKGSGGHAKHKTKKENLKYAPSGNVRKIVANVQNAEKKEKQARQRVNSVWRWTMCLGNYPRSSHIEKAIPSYRWHYLMYV